MLWLIRPPVGQKEMDRCFLSKAVSAAALLLLCIAEYRAPFFPAARAAEISPDDTAEREVAEWVLRQGGEVILHGSDRRIRDLDQLPAGQFRIHTLNVVDIHGSAADLARLGNLSDLRRLYVSSRTQLGRGGGGAGAAASWKFLANLRQLTTLVNSEPVISGPVGINDEALGHSWRAGKAGGTSRNPHRRQGDHPGRLS